jgi:Xaa-Pro dipeptidase
MSFFLRLSAPGLFCYQFCYHSALHKENLQAIIPQGSNHMSDDRFNRLQNFMTQDKLSTIALNPGPTLTYLTGLNFHLMERPIVLLFQRGHKPLLILPQLEMVKLEFINLPMHTVHYNDDPATWPDAFRSAFRHMNLEGARIGLEATRMRFLELNYLQQAAPTALFVAAEQVLGDLRAIKEPGEINEMRRAVKIAQQALKATLPMIGAGKTEKEIASTLTLELLRNGSDPELPFAPIVASGPNSANPHATPTERVLQPGDLLVIDWGARSNGYCSDLTRTFAIGHLDADLKNVYNNVLSANTTGRSECGPGVAAGVVDLATRLTIENAGYGQFFTHRTGHGIGLEDHESPYIFAGNKVILEPGMTFTIEPGIYLPGRGGVRIEDNILITGNGAESLSDYPRELTIL